MSELKKVLIVDDSAVMRAVLKAILDDGRELRVVGTASDPVIAAQKIATLAPDVLTLDIEMPRVDGLTFLRDLMERNPLPVVMCSSLTERGASATLAALEYGAFDFVTKPTGDLRSGVEAMASQIRAKVIAAANSRGRRLARPSAVGSRPVGASAAPPVPAAPLAFRRPATASAALPFFAIAASTGGTEALRAVVPLLPADSPGAVIVQHMPERFTAMFAARLDQLSQVSVREARDGDPIQPGIVYICPGRTQCVIERGAAGFVVRVLPPSDRELHNPAANVLFESIARTAGNAAIGAVLTGMGDDGARGLAAMRAAGARTLAQDEKTSVVFGMPREAIKQGGAELAVPLEKVAEALLHLAAK